MAFLRREYTVLAVFVAVVAVLLGLAISRETALAYIFGAISSVLAGFFGMKAATRANVRTSAAAKDPVRSGNRPILQPPGILFRWLSWLFPPRPSL